MDETEKALSEALDQTGFPFEHFAFQTAQRLGWSTRSSRLYIDAEEEKTREMDLLCYRSTKGAEVSTFTTLLISCRARTGKPWVLLTRPWPHVAGGWQSYPPIPVWTNVAALRFELDQGTWGREYFDLAEATGLSDWSNDSAREVFALQEFERVRTNQSTRHGNAPKGKDRMSESPRFKAIGDSSLYEGTMSLLKALAYEVKAVQSRRGSGKEKRVYQFNLLQVLDGDLYEAAFGGASPVVKKVDRYRYFARTMLEGKDFSARVDFCTRPMLETLLLELGKLHDFNTTHFDFKVKAFFKNVFVGADRWNLLVPLLEDRLGFALAFTAGDDKWSRKGWARLELESPNGPLKVLASLDEGHVNRLNEKSGFLLQLQRAISDIYRYSGAVEFHWDDDIPF